MGLIALAVCTEALSTMTANGLPMSSTNKPRKPANSSAVVFSQSLAVNSAPVLSNAPMMLSRLPLTAVAAWHSPAGVQAPVLRRVCANPVSSMKARVSSPRWAWTLSSSISDLARPKAASHLFFLASGGCVSTRNPYGLGFAAPSR